MNAFFLCQGSNLVMRAIAAMVRDGADEVVLETEITNEPALKLYENLGFVRDKRLFRYYLNGVDALRLKLWLKWMFKNKSNNSNVSSSSSASQQLFFVYKCDLLEVLSYLS